MKYVLAALCGLMVLFMGGCTVLSVLAFPFTLIPGGITFLNLAMLAVIFNWKNLQWRPAFYILGIADLLLAGLSVLTASSMQPADQPIFWVAAGILGLKGVLSLIYGAQNRGEA
jgi:hypothetical protein